MVDLNSAKQQAGDEDLSWLARNVHEWGANIALMGRILRNGEYSPVSTPGAAPKGVMWFTRDQWLTRRAELQNKPGWEDHPYPVIHQEPDGRWVGNDDEWASVDHWADGFYWKSICQGEVLGDWRDTLERRPQAAKSEPNPEPSSDDWHKRGELPPVGTECEVLLDGMWERVFIVGFSRRGQPVAENRFGAIYEHIGCQFRPIPTERERVAAELVDVMMAVPVSDRKTASESYMSMALAIYDHLHPENKS